MMGAPHLTDAVREQIFDLFEVGGISQNEIARTVGVERHTVNRLLSGLLPPAKPKRATERVIDAPEGHVPSPVLLRRDLRRVRPGRVWWRGHTEHCPACGGRLWLYPDYVGCLSCAREHAEVRP